LSASTVGEAFLSLLAILSLLGSAYTMRHAPLYPDRKGKKPLLAEDERLTWLLSALMPVNGAVCLLLTACFFFGAGSSYTIRPVLYLIPGGTFSLRLFSFWLIIERCRNLTVLYTAMLAVILLARETMLSVDLSALKDLQYEYKGA
jgi:hypothetical protein